MLDAARAPLDRSRRLALPEEDRAKATFAEHQRIADAIRSGDPEVSRAIEGAPSQIEREQD